MFFKLILGFVLLAGQLPFASADLTSFVEELQLGALRATFDTQKVEALLAGKGHRLDLSEQRSAALLVSIGILEPGDLNNSEMIESKIAMYRQGVHGKSEHLIGPFKEPMTLARLDELNHHAEGLHAELLKEKSFIHSLQQQLNNGVVTGYDLRPVNIGKGFDPTRTLTYSHSSIRHIKQLTALLASEGISGLLYVAPKISAFLFRDGWGEPPRNVSRLKNGKLIVNGREWVVFFEFASARDKLRFHNLVTKYAKKDNKDEQGLIADSWWQPFYYSSIQEGYLTHINLIILKAENTEATLTVLPGKLETVTTAFNKGAWKLTIKDIWVDKPFYRFLNGDFK